MYFEDYDTYFSESFGCILLGLTALALVQDWAGPQEPGATDAESSSSNKDGNVEQETANREINPVSIQSPRETPFSGSPVLPREIEELTESRGRPELGPSVATDDQREVSSVLAAKAGSKGARAVPPPPPPDAADSYGHYTVVLAAGIAWRSAPSFGSTTLLNEALVRAGTRMIGRVIRSDDGLEYFEFGYVCNHAVRIQGQLMLWAVQGRTQASQQVSAYGDG